MRILVLEDLVPTADSLQLLLSKVLGHDVFEAHTTEGAKIHLSVHPVDAAIIDLGVPTEGGEEVIRWMREQPSMAHIPVAIVTGKDSALSMDLSEFGPGPVKILLKPCDPERMMEVLGIDGAIDTKP